MEEHLPSASTLATIGDHPATTRMLHNAAEHEKRTDRPLFCNLAGGQPRTAQ
jgi:hypothetical protein